MFRFSILYFFLILLLLSIKCFTVVGERQKEGPGAGVIRTGFTCKFSLHLILSVVRLGVVKHVEKDTFLGQSMESIFFLWGGVSPENYISNRNGIKFNENLFPQLNRLSFLSGLNLRGVGRFLVIDSLLIIIGRCRLLSSS